MALRRVTTSRYFRILKRYITSCVLPPSPFPSASMAGDDLVGSSCPCPVPRVTEFPVGPSLPPENVHLYADWLCRNGSSGKHRDVEIDTYDGNVFNEDRDWRKVAKDVAELLKHHTGRRSVHAPTVSLEFPIYDSMVIAAMNARMANCLEFAEIVGASLLVLHSPFHFYGHPKSVHTKSDDLDDVIANIHEFLTPFLPKLKAIGAKVVFETCYDKAAEPLIALVRSFPRELVGLSVDVGHLQVVFDQSKHALPPHEFLRQCLPLVDHLHLHDNDGCADHHWTPGHDPQSRGVVDWASFFEVLAERWVVDAKTSPLQQQTLALPFLIMEGDSERGEETRAGARFIELKLGEAIEKVEKKLCEKWRASRS